MAKVTTNVYSIRQPSPDLIHVVQELNAELREWKNELPLVLGSVNAASLIAPFRRQSTALKLAYSHAVMYVNRPFLLKNFGATGTTDARIKGIIHDCISAASGALELVDSMASDGTVFHAFWWTHYVSFCALTVIYVWHIQQRTPFEERLFELAERCQDHLAKATGSNSPSRRYSIILQELREEAKQHAAGVALRSLCENGMGETAATNIDHYQQLGIVEGDGRIGVASAQATDIQEAASIPEGAGEWNAWQNIDWVDIDSLVCTVIAKPHVPAGVSSAYVVG